MTQGKQHEAGTVPKSAPLCSDSSQFGGHNFDSRGRRSQLGAQLNLIAGCRCQMFLKILISKLKLPVVKIRRHVPRSSVDTLSREPAFRSAAAMLLGAHQ